MANRQATSQSDASATVRAEKQGSIVKAQTYELYLKRADLERRVQDVTITLTIDQKQRSEPVLDANAPASFSDNWEDVPTRGGLPLTMATNITLQHVDDPSISIKFGDVAIHPPVMLSAHGEQTVYLGESGEYGKFIATVKEVQG